MGIIKVLLLFICKSLAQPCLNLYQLYNIVGSYVILLGKGVNEEALHSMGSQNVPFSLTHLALMRDLHSAVYNCHFMKGDK